jgi:KTSC domain
MNRIPVTSSNIAAIWYDEENLVLEMEFNNGSIYQYSWVPVNEYSNLMGASSHWTYFNQYIKDNYPVTKIK